MSSTSLRLREADRDHLIAGAAALGIEISPSAATNLGRFADVLDVWAPKMNLISCRSAGELVERHLLDSLALVAALPSGCIVDLGTGAGFPGIPLAILRPDQRFVLVEARRRRASFLHEVRRTLDLPNVRVLEQRAETPPSEYAHTADAVVSRATWSDDALGGVAQEWLADHGRLFWMRSEPLHAVPPPYVRETILRYRIGDYRPRCVEVLTMPG